MNRRRDRTQCRDGGRTSSNWTGKGQDDMGKTSNVEDIERLGEVAEEEECERDLKGKKSSSQTTCLYIKTLPVETSKQR